MDLFGNCPFALSIDRGLNLPGTNVNTVSTSVDEASRSIGRRWGILLLLAIGVLIAFVDRTSISSALAAKSFIGHFSLSNTDRGWVGAAFFWSYGLVQMPMGWLVDRYGVKLPYTVCFVLWCAATAVTGFVDTMFGLILTRTIVGAAEAVVIPASYRWIRNHFSERENGTAVGIFAMGNKFGPALGAPVAAWLIASYDWRLMFVLTGIAGLIWLLPWLLMVDRDLPGRADLPAISRRASSVSLGSILSSAVVWGGMISNFCYGYFTFYCMTWMPAYLVEQRGLSLKQSALYTFYSFAGIAIVAALAGYGADLLIARGRNAVMVRKAFVVAGFVGACTVVLGAVAQSVDVALFWNVFSLSCLGLATANNLALSRLTLIPAQAVGLVTGVQQVATSLAGGVAASLSGWLLSVSGSYVLPMYVIFAFLVLGAVSTVVLMQERWAPKVSSAFDEA
jgi:sugar phosphate permease